MNHLQRLIEAQRARITAALTERQTHSDALEQLRSELGDSTTLTAEQTARGTTARAEVTRIDNEVTQLRAVLDQWEAELRANQAAQELARQITPAGGGQPARAGGAQVGGEPAVYSRELAQAEGRSWLQDAYRSQILGDYTARERLADHGRWMRANGGMTERALATGGLNGLVPPQYLTNLVARVLRNGRPTANAIGSLPLPAEGMAIVIPKVATGTTVASQATQNTTVSNTDLVMATDITVPIVTVSGYQDVSRQSLERGSGVDEIVFADLAGAYAQEVDRQVLHGTGASNQMLGITATSGIYAATAFGAAVSATNFYSKVAGMVAAIGDSGAGVAADFIVMSPRRWGWLLSLVDSSGRPLNLAQEYGPSNAQGINSQPGLMNSAGDDPVNGLRIVGTFQGLPVVSDPNITKVAGTINEDLVIVMDSSKALLWEDDAAPKQLRFEQPLGHQLTVRLVAYGYAAFTAARYPVAFGKIGGLDTGTNGLIAPTF